jgi:endo-beta-N-acetylglucosaminidase D
MRRSDVFATQLRQLRDGEVEIRIERKKATRSPQANRWYWSCVVGLVAEHTGYTPDEIHEIYKAKFLPKRLAVSDGNGEIKGEFVIGGTTTKLSTAEFADYCDRIRQWAAEALDVIIPDPEARVA